MERASNNLNYHASLSSCEHGPPLVTSSYIQYRVMVTYQPMSLRNRDTAMHNDAPDASKKITHTPSSLCATSSLSISSSHATSSLLISSSEGILRAWVLALLYDWPFRIPGRAGSCISRWHHALWHVAWQFSPIGQWKSRRKSRHPAVGMDL